MYDFDVVISAKMTRKDYYSILGVEKTADQDIVKKAYKKLALELHPDRTGGDKTAEARFKEVNEAYSVIGNKESRERYDSMENMPSGIDWSSWTGDRGHGGFSMHDLQDLFEQQFDMRHNNAGARGNDIATHVRLTLAESFTGCKKDVTFSYDEKCKPCNGTGDAPGSQRSTCSGCQGTGVMLVNQGFIHLRMRCQSWGGMGTKRTKECPSCFGKGLTQLKRNITVTIAPGIADGNRVRLAGQGSSGNKGSGDAYLIISIDRDAKFSREGDNLLTIVDLNIAQAAMGATIDITMPDGSIEHVTFPEGSQQGHEQRLKNKGMPKLSNAEKRGTLKARANVVVPKTLTDEQREILKTLSKTL